MIPIEEQLLDAIAGQARMAYAAAQLAACQVALDLWQHRAKQRSSEFSAEYVQHEFAYYTQQMARWQQYIVELAPEPYIIRSSIAAE